MRYGSSKPEVTARRLASQMWGTDIQRQRKLADGIWWFTTNGHGGLIVDTAVRPELNEFNTGVAYHGHFYCNEQHFAAFEEDCMAALVEWTYPEIIPAIQKELVEPYCSQPTEEFIRERTMILRESLAHWNPDWLKIYPEPGVRIPG